MAPVYNEKILQRLRNLHDQIEIRFRAMEALGVSKETYSCVVVPVLMRKLPESMRIDMIRFGKNHMNWNIGRHVGSFSDGARDSGGTFPHHAASSARRQKTRAAFKLATTAR